MPAKHTTALDGNARDLFEASMRWAEPWWDEAFGLLHDSGDTKANGPAHTVRGSVWYAFGLLMRDGPGDTERAVRVIDTVLNYQFVAPDRAFHGTFYRAPEEPYPPDNAIVWKDYDPNWREFIITVLALALLTYPEKLPNTLVARLDEAIRKAVAGAQARGLSASYTNIALMNAWMMCFAGKRFLDADWIAAGERMGREVYRLFKQCDAFAEYNSPTYYGVDLYALALWRAYPAIAPVLAPLGAEMEALLWRDTAQFYHAGLHNLAGPYDRSYGMDMRRYLAVVGLWMRLALDKDSAPLPDTDKPFEHDHDMGFVPPIVFLGAQVPDDALAHLRAFQGERQVEHVIAESPRRVATAWLGVDRMLGGEFMSGAAPASGQLHPATLHWQMHDGQTGWVRMRYINPVDAQAGRNRLEIATTGEIAFQIYAPGATLALDRWQMPGLTVRVESNADTVDIQPHADMFEVCYTIAAGAPITCTLTCEDL
jgi:hypothetical protein